MEFEIEKNVPVPVTEKNRKYPINKLEVGESFFIPDVKLPKMYNAISYHKFKYPDTNFKCRSMDGGVRVWRIK